MRLRFAGNDSLVSKASQLTLSQVARILAIVPNWLAEDLGPHTIDSLFSKELKGLGHSKRRDSSALRKLQVAHGVDLGRWVEVNVLAGLEVFDAQLLVGRPIDDELGLRANACRGRHDLRCSCCSHDGLRLMLIDWCLDSRF